VEHMLWVAAGKELPARLTAQPCLDPQGWAMESRVYAEVGTCTSLLAHLLL
jgi:acetyl/propionyl-CoA carboxylase alpha subunit